MTVQELIDQLTKLPPDADVWTVTEHHGAESYRDSKAILKISTGGYIYIIPDDEYIAWWVDNSW